MTNKSLEPSRPLEPDYGRRMSHAEAVLLCRYAKAACPQQAFDEYTPDAWADLLSDLLFDDCKEAIKNVVQRQPFVAPAEIREAVALVRRRRIEDFGRIPEPPGDLDIDDPRTYQKWLWETTRAIADGTLKPGDEVPMPEVPELGLAGRSVDDLRALVVKPERRPEPPPLTRPQDRLREPEPVPTELTEEVAP